MFNKHLMQLPTEIWRNEISKYIPDAKTFFNYCLVIKDIPESIKEAKMTEFSILYKEDGVKCYILPNRNYHGRKETYFLYIHEMVGKISYVMHFKNGVKHGLFQDFDTEGELHHTAIFKDGKLVSEKYEKGYFNKPFYMFFENNKPYTI